VTYDALIIGGGPAGATAAFMLVRAGWSVAVVEKAEYPRRKVCGEFISATSLPLLREFGIAEAFAARAGPEIKRVGFFAPTTAAAAPMPQPRPPADAWGRALGREHLDALLLDRARQAGAEIWQPWSARALRRAGDRHLCGIARRDDRRELTAHLVIVAHGSWQAGHLLPDGAKRAAPSDLLAFKAHFRDCALAPDLMPLITFPGGYGGMVHSDDGRVSLSCCIRRDVMESIRPAGAGAGDAVLAHITAFCAGARDTLSGATLDGQWLSAGPIRPGVRARYAGGMLFAGNIAGEAHPIIAEGISMAMQSSGLLCHALACEPAVPAAHRRDEIGHWYSAEWRRLFTGRVRAAAVFARALMRPQLAVLAGGVVKRAPGLLTFGARLSGKMRLSGAGLAPRIGPQSLANTG
jgi:flavin-dependent dehydrogenase